LSSNEYSDDKPLVAGSLRGYRFWHVNATGLHAINAGYTWQPGLNHAMCNKVTTVCGEIANHKFEPKCTCGFYARYSPDDLADLAYGSISLSTDHLVIGVVEGTGTIARGTRGFRAEKAEILAIARFPMHSDPAFTTLLDVAHVYNIPFYNNFATLCKNFPPDEELLAWAKEKQEEEAAKKRHEQNVQIYIEGMANPISANNAYLNFGNPLSGGISTTATRAWFQYSWLNVNSTNIIKNFGA
jgi:hypothetical protein